MTSAARSSKAPAAGCAERRTSAAPQGLAHVPCASAPLAGYLAKKRGQKAGLADITVVHDGRVTLCRAEVACWRAGRNTATSLQRTAVGGSELVSGPLTNPDQRLPQAPQVEASGRRRRAAQTRPRS